MRLAHVALWTRDLEEAAEFWSRWFGAQVSPRYESLRRPGFTSRFARIGDSLRDGLTIELMSAPWVQASGAPQVEQPGWAHVAISVGSAEAVRTIASELNAAGLLVSAPRTTGDGFYEAVARTPDGALVEITP